MSWIELHQSVFRHPKTLAVADDLGISRIVVAAHLASLWCWAIDALPESGGPVSAPAVELAAEWEGEPGALFSALLAARYIERRRKGGNYYLRHWSDYSARLYARRFLARDRKRKERLQKSATLREEGFQNSATLHRERAKQIRNVTRDGHADVTPTNQPTNQPLSAAKQRAAGPPLVDTFLKSVKTNEQVAALVDIATANGQQLDGGRAAGMLKRADKTAVLDALHAALGKRPAVLADYMEGILRNGRTPTPRKSTANQGNPSPFANYGR